MPKPEITPGRNYITLTDWNDGDDPSISDQPMSFSGACDLYAEHMNGDRETIVWRLDLATESAAAMAVDVTEDALACIRRRYAQRRAPLPECFGGEPEPCEICNRNPCVCDDEYDRRAEAGEIAT